VACDDRDAAVGMVIASVREGSVYIEEIDVLPQHGRRGLGARLLEGVCAWARTNGYPALTLSTFRDVPGTAPSTAATDSETSHPRSGPLACTRSASQEARHGFAGRGAGVHAPRAEPDPPAAWARRGQS